MMSLIEDVMAKIDFKAEKKSFDASTFPRDVEYLATVFAVTLIDDYSLIQQGQYDKVTLTGAWWPVEVLPAPLDKTQFHAYGFALDDKGKAIHYLHPQCYGDKDFGYWMSDDFGDPMTMESAKYTMTHWQLETTPQKAGE